MQSHAPSLMVIRTANLVLKDLRRGIVEPWIKPGGTRRYQYNYNVLRTIRRRIPPRQAGFSASNFGILHCLWFTVEQKVFLESVFVLERRNYTVLGDLSNELSHHRRLLLNLNTGKVPRFFRKDQLSLIDLRRIYNSRPRPLLRDANWRPLPISWLVTLSVHLKKSI